MICVSLQNKQYDELIEIVSSGSVEMAEIRLDFCHLSSEEIRSLFNYADIPLIATCRSSDVITPKEALSMLTAAIEGGAGYVDLDIEDKVLEKMIRSMCRDNGTLLIRSYHNYETTPTEFELKAIVKRCLKGGDVAKIATMASSEEDCRRVLSLYLDHYPDYGLIAFCMGEQGTRTRIDSLRMGSPWTYSSLSEGEATAPGQMSLQETNIICSSQKFRRDIVCNTIPCSKSFAQRAIIAAAIAEGESLISNFSLCDDTQSAISAASDLGATICIDGEVVRIEGTGGRPRSIKSIHTGESGLLTRLMIPIGAVIGSEELHITGEKSLVGRHLNGVVGALSPFGVEVKSQDEKKTVSVPLIVNGRLTSGRCRISGKDGSQIISGLLMALPLASGNSFIKVTNPKSVPYILMTRDILSKFTIELDEEIEGDASLIGEQDWSGCKAINYTIKGHQHYRGTSLSLEGDWSSAANLLVAGAIYGSATIGGLNTSSIQADKKILDILTDAGASISQYEDARISVRKAPLEGFEADLSQSPDIFPIAALLAAFCQGTSIISGASRLTNKESNRAKAIMEMLSNMGVNATLSGDLMTIRGEMLTSRILNGRLLKGGEYSSHHDHRMAMALAIASPATTGGIAIDDTECISKSFPSFFKLWNQ